MIQIIAGALFLIAGSGGAFLGLMFLIVSSGSGSRLITGIMLSAIGAALLASGIFLFRKGMRERPGSVHDRILGAAAKHNGVIAAEVLAAETGGGDSVEFALAAMVRKGRAIAVDREGRKIYTFPELQFKLKFKKCPYCGSDYPVKENIERCPSCGGDLKIVSESSDGGGDKFSMDI